MPSTNRALDWAVSSTDINCNFDKRLEAIKAVQMRAVKVNHGRYTSCLIWSLVVVKIFSTNRTLWLPVRISSIWCVDLVHLLGSERLMELAPWRSKKWLEWHVIVNMWNESTRYHVGEPRQTLCQKTALEDSSRTMVAAPKTVLLRRQDHRLTTVKFFLCNQK